MDNYESENKFDMNDLNVGDMINSFKGVANNPLSKFILIELLITVKKMKEID